MSTLKVTKVTTLTDVPLIGAGAEAERVAARESAMAKLSVLGLNEVEINAMMGGV